MLDPIYIAGPTASGKSAVAILLAERLGGEIISVDSMQVYRGMDIGTAKPTPEERARVPHHLIDVAEVTEPFDVARFLDLARSAEKQIKLRGRVPIYCGGTGLYFKALVAGIGEGPSANPELRRELEATPLPMLLEELQQSDPELFAQIDKSNSRRVVRAIEVLRMTGQKFSAQRAAWKEQVQHGHWFGLQRERSDLVRRIETRVDEMFARGLVEETRTLLGRGLESNRTAMQSLGYRQVVEFLKGGPRLPETIELVKQKTRQYAKRQMTWFRHQLRLQWLPVSEIASPSEISDSLLAALSAQPPATI